MADSHNDLHPILPAKVLGEIAKAVPDSCKDKLIVIGSLAVGFYYRDELNGMAVRTKDADCLLSPRIAAVHVGIKITEELMAAGWKQNPTKEHYCPGTEDTPKDDLPAVRLTPPGVTEWFIELLTVPEKSSNHGREWVRLTTSYGHFGLCSLRYLSLTDFNPIVTDLGICIARPEMMALANLLHHPKIESEIMSAGFAGQMDIKRSNKDLGRVLAIGRLAMGRDEDTLMEWPEMWSDALKERFPDEWSILACKVGNGLRELLDSDQDLEQALHTCTNGLLASKPPTLEQLRIAGRRMLQDAIEPLELEGHKV